VSIGGIFLFLSFLIFFLNGVGIQILPRAQDFALAALALGILLAGLPLPPWRLP
jgi:hypothetical protein